MTPAAAPISLGDVLTEIRRVNPARALPISLGDADVRALAGKPSGPISLSDLYGKSSYTPMTIVATDGHASGITNGGPAFTASAFVSVAVSSGDPGYFYLWEVLSVSDDGFTFTNTTDAQCTVRHLIPQFGGYVGEAALRCRVTDSTGHVVYSNTVTASFNYEQDA